jgi:hypothetical protein
MKLKKRGSESLGLFYLQKHEGNELIFFPPIDEDKIWDGLMFLLAVDTQVAPGVYLYTIKDVQGTFEELFNTTFSATT